MAAASGVKLRGDGSVDDNSAGATNLVDDHGGDRNGSDDNGSGNSGRGGGDDDQGDDHGHHGSDD